MILGWQLHKKSLQSKKDSLSGKQESASPESGVCSQCLLSILLNKWTNQGQASLRLLPLCASLSLSPVRDNGKFKLVQHPKDSTPGLDFGLFLVRSSLVFGFFHQ